MPDPDVAASIAAAYNRWLADAWLDADERYRAALVAAPQDPALAAREIRTAAEQHRGFVSVLLPLTNILMGQRHYYPIYEAAAELGPPGDDSPELRRGHLPYIAEPGGRGSDRTTSNGTPDSARSSRQTSSACCVRAFSRDFRICVSSSPREDSPGCPTSCGVWTRTSRDCETRFRG
jgi:hypothetical protein